MGGGFVVARVALLVFVLVVVLLVVILPVPLGLIVTPSFVCCCCFILPTIPTVHRLATSDVQFSNPQASTLRASNEVSNENLAVPRPLDCRSIVFRAGDPCREGKPVAQLAVYCFDILSLCQPDIVSRVMQNPARGKNQTHIAHSPQHEIHIPQRRAQTSIELVVLAVALGQGLPGLAYYQGDLRVVFLQVAGGVGEALQLCGGVGVVHEGVCAVSVLGLGFGREETDGGSRDAYFGDWRRRPSGSYIRAVSKCAVRPIIST